MKDRLFRGERALRGRFGLAALAAYIACIPAANWLTDHYGLVAVAPGLEGPAGVYLAGLAFTFRDLTQEGLGRRPVLFAILIGALLSSLVASSRLALASGVAFLGSELADFGVYTPLRNRGRWVTAILASNTVGLIFDSVLFLLLAFGSLEFLLGQLVGKSITSVLLLPGIWMLRGLAAQRPD